MTDQCFRMKGTTLTSIVLEVVAFEPESFEAQLADKIATAPQFFTRSSLILHLTVPLLVNELTALVTLCRSLELQPMAVKGDTEGLKEAINELGMADVSQSKSSEKELVTGAAAQKETNSSPDLQVQINPSQDVKPAKIVTRPVRSGQQVYAERSDLIILAAVSEGAEILADGNIHVYGTLRGRALAGVKGNIHARIFCQLMEAELVSIAGRFVMQENIQGQCWKQPAQAYLDEDTLLVEGLS